ncbi:MAG TPA: hypothetical protein VHM02_05140, partial [Thermoanaerobaculia bacterium]|nr:hypothetical protein [Thermoanaerobaculia bacterium]
RAIRDGRLSPGRPDERLDEAVAAGVVDGPAAEAVRRAAELRAAATAVDDFPADEPASARAASSAAL